MAQESQQSEFKKDLVIYFIILGLTALIVGISHLQLGMPGIILIVTVAMIEASILGYYFMHLMMKKKTVHLVLLLTVIAFIALLFWPVWDILYSPRTPSEYTTN